MFDAGVDPPCGSRLVLRLGRAARRSDAARSPHDRRARHRAGVELRGQGVRRADGDGNKGGSSTLSTRIDRSRQIRRVCRSEQTESSRSFATPPRSSNRSRSTRRSSTSPGSPAPSVRHARSPRRSGVAYEPRSACRSPSVSPRPNTAPKVASQAGKPDGLLVVPEGGELDFLWPLPVNRLWGVGKKTTEKLGLIGIGTVGDLANVDVERLTGAWAGQPPIISTPWPTIGIPAASTPTAGASRSAPSGRSPPVASPGDDARIIMFELVDQISARMRSKEMMGRTVTDESARQRVPVVQQIGHAAGGDVVLVDDRAGRHPIVPEQRAFINSGACTKLGLSVSNLSSPPTTCSSPSPSSRVGPPRSTPPSTRSRPASAPRRSGGPGDPPPDPTGTEVHRRADDQPADSSQALTSSESSPSLGGFFLASNGVQAQLDRGPRRAHAVDGPDRIETEPFGRRRTPRSAC